MTARALTVASLVATFSARRAVLLAAALAPPRSIPALERDPPPLALVIPVHDEADHLPGLLGAIDRIDYPAERLEVVLVDDCSTDGSLGSMRDWVKARPGARLLELDRPHGKASALMRGLASVPAAEIVAFCDADVRPEASSARELAAAFGDSSVAAAGALLWPSNPGAGTVARYAAVESWVHQLVTSRGKDRLDLNPPALGGMCAYRRAALLSVGGFRPDARGEDVEATVALTRDGWRTRIAPRAEAHQRLADSRKEYWRQHMRWGRGQMDSAAVLTARTQSGPPRPAGRGVSWARRTEAALATTGYLDRLAFAAAAALAARGELSPWWTAGYAVAAAAEVVAAVAMAGALRTLPSCAKALLVLFPLDVAATAVAVGRQALRHPPEAWVTGSSRRAAQA